MNDETAKENTITIVLDGELAIQRAQQLKETLLAQLREGKSIDLDLTNATAIDVTGLQLFCSAHRTAKKGGRELRIASPLPAAIAQTVQTAGFTRRRDCQPNCDHPCLWNQGE
jgi:anti-anti-sigma factor